MSRINEELFDSFMDIALREDIGDGDHSSLSCIPDSAAGKACLIVKEKGIIAGLEMAVRIFDRIDPRCRLECRVKDGEPVSPGNQVFIVSGPTRSILKAERLVLNVVQRMSGIATLTRLYVEELSGMKTRILDTRKTAPGIRLLDKEAVRIGGGMNHRMGLWDMILLKDNHIDFAGGIEPAVRKARQYLQRENMELRIEVEARSLEDVAEILRVGGVNRIMLDNFDLETTRKAVELVAGRYEVESSGRISLDNLRDYAGCGVDYISVGALTHQARSLDLSLKALP